jgi:putative transposase
VRQHLFVNEKFLNYQAVNALFIKEKQIDYYALPTKVSQHVQKLVHQNFVSFFGLLKAKKAGKLPLDQNVSIPKYLDKVSGRQVLFFTEQTISKTRLQQGYLKLSGVSFEIKTEQQNIKFARIVHKNSQIVIEIGYEVKTYIQRFNGNVASLDLGQNNLATLAFTNTKPIIINGKPLKSINQFYNKEKATLQARQDEAINTGLTKNKTTQRMERLTRNRNNKIKDYLHKASRLVVNQLVSKNISVLIIGYNKGWKQDINIGKRNNQNFVSIPFLQFVDMLVYKCALVGIKVVLVNESYTSKCSFIDGEQVKKHKTYKGKRVKRGLFRTSTGILVNADVNGACNILVRGLKVIRKSIKLNRIEVCSTPTVFTVKA